MTDLTKWQPPNLEVADTLKGRFARLERLSADAHAAALHKANGEDDSIWTYLMDGPFATFSNYATWVRKTETRSDVVFYAIWDHGLARWCGVASYLRDVPDMGVIEVGNINFAKPLKRRPAATEAIYLMMAQVMAAGYRRFEWKCNARNLASRRAAQRFGFSFEGIFRQHMVVKGQNRDTAWYALTDQEWPGLQRAYRAWLASENFDAAGNQHRRLSDLTQPWRVAEDPGL